MKKEIRELGSETWQWGEGGVEVINDTTKETHDFGWEEVVGIRRLGVKLSDGRVFLLRGSEVEVKQLKEELSGAWKVFNSVGWCAAAMKNMTMMNFVFGKLLLFLPIIVFIIPWGGWAVICSLKGAADTEVLGRCLKIVSFGLVMLGGFFVLYLFVIKKRGDQITD